MHGGAGEGGEQGGEGEVLHQGGRQGGSGEGGEAPVEEQQALVHPELMGGGQEGEGVGGGVEEELGVGVDLGTLAAPLALPQHPIVQGGQA